MSLTVARRLAPFVLAIFTTACLVSHHQGFRSVAAQNGVTVKSPVKAHLKDGSTVVFADGVHIEAGLVRGDGVKHVSLTEQVIVTEVPLSAIVGMETYDTGINYPRTIIVSTLVTAGIVAGAALLAVAIFGSCPTVYSGAGSGEQEEAELFSNSIAPLLEGRDIDRLYAQPDAKGIVRLDVRNEAMETHYINHLQLLEIAHAPAEFVVPDSFGEPIIVGALRAPAEARDRSGRDVFATIQSVDDRAYASDQRRIDNATAADMDDWIDLMVSVPPESTSTTLVFRQRNSLLSTVMLYDVILGSAGAAALDWLNRDLAQIANVVEMGRWHQRRTGLHLSVWRNGAFREVVRLADSGPISWHDVAAVIPVEPGETTLRVRASFLADHWRFDRIGIATSMRSAAPRAILPTQVTSAADTVEPAALESLRTPDENYLQTQPGQRFSVVFEVGSASGTETRTFLLASQGYYTEWIRPQWIAAAGRATPFRPSDDALLEGLHRWSAERATFEARFMSARVPVR